MRILAIETTALAGSVALLEAGHVLAETKLADDVRSAQSLAPAIAVLLSKHAWSADSLELIAVAQGPGSFTGLRVGVTTAKTLAYACDAQVLGIDTLEVLAAQADAEKGGRVWPIIDAQRNQLFTARFQLAGAEFPGRQQPTVILDVAAWLDLLQSGDVVIGPPLATLAARFPSGVLSADRALWQPRAATVGRLAWRDFSQGRRDDLWSLAPQYYRLSAAEEKAAQK